CTKTYSTPLICSFQESLCFQASIYSNPIKPSNSEPALIIVSSLCIQEYPETFFFFNDIFFGLYFCIHTIPIRNTVSFDKT
ncbi:MAG: hypothetical protein M3Z01_07855, partial [Thermoproteota archaeon]|nr:hypothetical protein [Thermoproteota archaeon]